MDESFEMAQWALRSDAAVALNQMWARLGAGDDRLARLIRNRQASLKRRVAAEYELASALGEKPDAKNKAHIARLRQTIEASAAAFQQDDAAIASAFPQYTALARLQPLTVTETQALLRGDEALLLYLSLPGLGSVAEQGYIWAVTKTVSRWAKITPGFEALRKEVTALRCGLDPSGWGKPICMKLRVPPAQGGQLRGLPAFDLARAKKLYEALFGPVSDLIRTRRGRKGRECRQSRGATPRDAVAHPIGQSVLFGEYVLDKADEQNHKGRA